MRSAVEMILHSFLDRSGAEKKERLIRFLSESEQERLKKLPPVSAISPEGFTNGAMLERVHWSWFLPTLKSYSRHEQSLFLASLDPSSAHSLAEAIPCSVRAEPPTSIGRSYLRQVLLDSLIGPHDRIIPVQYLPSSPLNRLLQLSKRQLIHLIDLLAIHDLSVEIRQIVETKILKKLYSLLSEEERKLLKQISARPEPYAFPKIGLDRWDGTEESLRHMLHRRGLGRLGLALSGQDPALVWYVCHMLDIGRGNALFKLCVREGGAAAVDTAAKQVEELLGHESL